MTVQINGDNTIAAPGFSGPDADTGLQTATNELSLVTGGSARLFIDSSGRAGVGTTSFPDPGAGLNLANGFLYLYDPQDAADAGRSIKFATNGGVTGRAQVEIKGLQNASGTGGGYFTVLTMPAGGTSRQERLRITADGKVGIGTTSPSEPLHVNSGTTNNIATFESTDVGAVINITDSVGKSSIETNNTQLKIGVDPNNAVSGSNLRLQVDGSTKLLINDSGNVGIGTTSPQNVLEVNGRGRFQGHTTSATSGSGLEVAYVSGSTTGSIITYNRSTSTYLTTNIGGNTLTFSISGTEKARIDSSGRLLVGTSSAQSTQQVQAANTGGENFGAFRFVNSAGPCDIVLHKSRGSLGSHTIVQNNDAIGSIAFRGSDGSAYRNAAAINAYVDGTPGASDMPGRLSFRTTADGSTSPTERMQISSAGHVLPGSNNSYDLGSSSLRWRNVYTNDLNLSNEGSSNDVDGTWGNYTIQEGKDDLFLINRRNGKKYKFNLTEVN